MTNDLESKVFLVIPKNFDEGQPLPLWALKHFKGMKFILGHVHSSCNMTITGMRFYFVTYIYLYLILVL